MAPIPDARQPFCPIGDGWVNSRPTVSCDRVAPPGRARGLAPPSATGLQSSVARRISRPLEPVRCTQKPSNDGQAPGRGAGPLRAQACGRYRSMACTSSASQVGDQHLTGGEARRRQLQRLQDRGQHRSVHADRGRQSGWRATPSRILLDQAYRPPPGRSVPISSVSVSWVSMPTSAAGRVRLQRGQAAGRGGADQVLDPVRRQERHQLPGLLAAARPERAERVLLRPVLAVHRLAVPHQHQRRGRRLRPACWRTSSLSCSKVSRCRAAFTGSQDTTSTSSSGARLITSSGCPDQ